MKTPSGVFAFGCASWAKTRSPYDAVCYAEKFVGKSWHKVLDKPSRKWYTKAIKREENKAMSTIYTLIGLPASGKSTFTKAMDGCVVVSSDAIREELFGSAEVQRGHSHVFAIARERIAMAIRDDRDVVFDATNLTVGARRVALDQEAHHVAVLFTTPVDECKRRNALRERHVPEIAIDKMALRLVAPTLGEGFDEVWVL